MQEMKKRLTGTMPSKKISCCNTGMVLHQPQQQERLLTIARLGTEQPKLRTSYNEKVNVTVTLRADITGMPVADRLQMPNANRQRR